MPRNAYRTDWAPQNRAEVCACISVLAREGKLTPDDEEHIAGWVEFRQASRATPGTETREADNAR